jgi:hypothetical protein
MPRIEILATGERIAKLGASFVAGDLDPPKFVKETKSTKKNYPCF